MNLGEVFILEASKNRTECGNERSSSYGTIEITVMMCEQYKPAKEKALQTRVTTHWQPWCLESICECTLKKCTFLYCCLKKRVLFNTFKLSNDLSSYYFFLNQIMHKCVNSFLPLQKYCLIWYKLQITAGLPWLPLFHRSRKLDLYMIYLSFVSCRQPTSWCEHRPKP